MNVDVETGYLAYVTYHDRAPQLLPVGERTYADPDLARNWVCSCGCAQDVVVMRVLKIGGIISEIEAFSG